MSEELKPDECIEKLKQYEFKDDIGHPLEKCVEYIQLCAYTKKEWNTMCRLRWSKEPPKEPGWYWYRNTNKLDVHIVCISYEWDEYMVDFELAARFVLETPYNWHNPHPVVLMDGEWAGPIPEPEE